MAKVSKVRLSYIKFDLIFLNKKKKRVGQRRVKIKILPELDSYRPQSSTNVNVKALPSQLEAAMGQRKV